MSFYLKLNLFLLMGLGIIDVQLRDLVQGFTANQIIVSTDSIDPNKTWNSLDGPTNHSYYKTFRGQTNILRYSLTFPSEADVSINLRLKSIGENPISFVMGNNTTNRNKSVLIQRFFVSRAGSNYPCISGYAQTAFLEDALTCVLPIGKMNYFPIDEKNVSASNIIVEVFLRLPIDFSNGINNMKFQLEAELNGQLANPLTRSFNEFPKPVDLLRNNFSTTAQFNQDYSISTSESSLRQTVTLNVTLMIQQFNNAQTKFVLRIDPLQILVVESFKVIEAGRNVDGFMSDIKDGLLNYSRIGREFTIDFGVITNTGLAHKLGDYDEDVDDLIEIEVKFYLNDSPSLKNNDQITYLMISYFNSDIALYGSARDLTFMHNGNDEPKLDINATFIEDTSIPFVSGTRATVKFTMTHRNDSKRNAINTTALFFLPPYVLYEKLNFCNDANHVIKYDSVLKIEVQSLNFTSKLICEFSVLIDPNKTYSGIVNKLGFSPPKTLHIPYTTLTKIFYRPEDKYEDGHIFYSDVNHIFYTPEAVIINSKPSSPLFTSVDRCPITSSVPGSLPENVISANGGWKSGYRSISWYESGSNYVTIPFKRLKDIFQISMSQLDSSDDSTPFSAFKISYSVDGLAYAELPEQKIVDIDNKPIVYDVPTPKIVCRYLRIHITNVVNASSLVAASSGFKLNEIYGEPSKNTEEIACLAETFNQLYTPRSYLYDDASGVIIVCDENLERSSSECYINTGNEWRVLSKIVATVTTMITDISKESTVYVYGIASDKISYVRSDDFCLSWTIITNSEYTTMATQKMDSTRYKYKDYTVIQTSQRMDSVTVGPWQIDSMGLSNSGMPSLSWWDLG